MRSNDSTPLRVTKTCPACGESFTRYRSQKATFCSRACAAVGRHTTAGHHADYVCEVCHVAFRVSASTRQRRYCSKECEATARTLGPLECACHQCGRVFTYPRNQERRHRRYCSLQCLGIARRHGRRMTSSGYIDIRLPDGSWTQEHNYIMSQIIGRPIADNEEVHHRNLIRSDNDPSNLQLLTKSEHRRLHMTMKKAEGKMMGGAHSA